MGFLRFRSEDVIELGFFRLCWVCLEVGLLGFFILGFVLVVGFFVFWKYMVFGKDSFDFWFFEYGVF